MYALRASCLRSRRTGITSRTPRGETELCVREPGVYSSGSDAVPSAQARYNNVDRIVQSVHCGPLYTGTSDSLVASFEDALRFETSDATRQDALRREVTPQVLNHCDRQIDLHTRYSRASRIKAGLYGGVSTTGGMLVTGSVAGGAYAFKPLLNSNISVGAAAGVWGGALIADAVGLSMARFGYEGYAEASAKAANSTLRVAAYEKLR